MKKEKVKKIKEIGDSILEILDLAMKDNELTSEEKSIIAKIRARVIIEL